MVQFVPQCRLRSWILPVHEVCQVSYEEGVLDEIRIYELRDYKIPSTRDPASVEARMTVPQIATARK